VTWRALLCTTGATFVLSVLHGKGFNLGAAGLLNFKGLSADYNIVELIPVKNI